VAGGQVAAAAALFEQSQAARQAQWRADKAVAVAQRKAAAPAAVRAVLDGGFSGEVAGPSQASGWRSSAEYEQQVSSAHDVTAWLVAAHASAHVDPATKRLARLVLGMESFARSMERLDIWQVYKEGLGTYLAALGAPLAERFVRDGLREKLGDLSLPPHRFVAADQARCAAGGRKHALRSDIAGIVPLPIAWDLSEPVARQRCERVFTHMLVLVAIALNEEFHDKMREILAPFVVQDEGIMQKNKDGSWRLTPQKGVARMEW
jgi:hypothetical protein